MPFEPLPEELVKLCPPGTPVTYLVDIEPRLAHAGHYVGKTTDLAGRWHDHTHNANGSRIIHAALAAGCTIRLVRVWVHTGPDTMEWRLKQRANRCRTNRSGQRKGVTSGSRVLCPRCNPDDHGGMPAWAWYRTTGTLWPLKLAPRHGHSNQPPTYQPDACRSCGAPVAPGSGWQGRCGPCADHHAEHDL